jgi:hypothetical protein
MKKLILLGAVLLIAVVVWFLLSKRKGNSSQPRVIEEFDTGRGRRLLTLLNGDVPAAKQLVIEMREKYPGKDREWCIGQAIANIEGDRE